MEKAAKMVKFRGKVQGVGFRFTAMRVATRYEITGYVRNLPDGSVEMLTQGYPEDIEDCIRDIQESFTGYLSETDVKECPLSTSITDFKITF